MKGFAARRWTNGGNQVIREAAQHRLRDCRQGHYRSDFVVFLCAGLFMLFLSGGSLLDPDKTIREADQGMLMLAFMGLAFCGFP